MEVVLVVVLVVAVATNLISLSIRTDRFYRLAVLHVFITSFLAVSITTQVLIRLPFTLVFVRSLNNNKIQ